MKGTIAKEGRKLIRQKDAAAFINRTVAHVRRLYNDDKLEGELIGGKLHLYVDSLRRFKLNPPHIGRPLDSLAKKPARTREQQELREYNRLKMREWRKRQREAAAKAASKVGKKARGQGR